MGLNLRGTTGSVEINPQDNGDDIILTCPNSTGTMLVDATSGGVSIADSISHTGNTGTAIRFPANDTFTVQTNSTEALRVTSTQRIGIGTASPDAILHTFGANTNFIKIETGDGGTNPIVMHENPDRVWHTGLRGDTNDSYVIRDATSTVNRIAITTTGITSVTGTLQVNGNNYPSSGPLSNRNFVINGGMQIAQRATERTSVTAGAACTTVDRWRNTMNTLGTWTIRQSSDKPVGFTSSLEYVCTTADASPAAGGFVVIEQRVEAQNLQSLGFGNADARSFTVSFWVKSNKTGAASFDCYQDQEANERMFSTSYTINSADTWEHKVINVPADVSGDIPNNSDIGLHLEWWLNGGSTFTGGAYQTTWANLTQANRNVQNLGVGGAINDNFKITGVQLELGDVATPFEHLSVGDELRRCQRYYFESDTSSIWQGNTSTGGAYSTNNQFDVPMRAAPTIENVTMVSSTGFSAVQLNGTQTSDRQIIVFGTCNSTGNNRFFIYSYIANAEL